MALKITREQLQEQCEVGQQQLMATRYLDAAATLAAAEELASEAKDFDTLARLYMPLQEARRQVRQRSGEGWVTFDLVAADAELSPEPQSVLEKFPHGQLLVAGWGSIQPAVDVRRIAREQSLYVETFLAAAYPITGGSRAVVVVPLEEIALPDPRPRSIDSLLAMLPAHCLVFGSEELPRGSRRGTTETYGQVMAMWERLHSPFLASADMEIDPVRKMVGFRKAIRVDSACELAHQKLSDVAKDLKRAGKSK
jgi:hypothetical protein